ncbi:GNAT family N-acetyltransferase [Rariglobus hedericola]|nr:GNAT family N-acetyltransferase [Rariglobus hedericola]
MNGVLRLYRSEDLAAVLEIYSEAVREIAPALYTPAQVDAWAAFAEGNAELVPMLAQGHRVVIESEAGIEAFAVLDPADYVSLLYCRARASRQGYATQLLAELETEARRLGVTRVHTAASLISHPLFLRQGYTVDHPERVERNGVAFDRYRMSKRL